MDILGIVDIPLWAVYFVLGFYLLYRYNTCRFDTWKKHGIPGPKPIPFFGNTLALFDPKVGFRKCIANWEAQYGKVVGIHYMRKPILMISDLDVLKEVLVKQFSNFADRYFIGEGKMNNQIVKEGVFFETGANWQRIRRIMSPTFSSGKLKQLIPFINKTAHHLSEKAQEHARNNTMFDAKDAFGAFSLDSIAGLAFGLDANSQSNLDLPFIKNAKSLLTFKAWSKLKITIAGMFPFVLPLFEYFDIGFFDSQSCKYFEKMIDSLLSHRKTNSNEEQPSDFLQLLLNAEAEDDSEFDGNVIDRKLTSKEIAAQCIIFIIAGYETSSSVLQFLSYELSRNKSVQAKIYEEIQEVLGDEENPNYDHVQNMKYLSAVIHETLRMYPPINLLSRDIVKSCTIKGISFPQSCAIFIPVYNIGRDPSNFVEPDEFRPERYLDSELQTLNDISFLPFGFGPRHCVGMRLGLMGLKLAMIQLLRKVSIEDATPKVLEIEDFNGLTVPKEPIKLLFRDR